LPHRATGIAVDFETGSKSKTEGGRAERRERKRENGLRSQPFGQASSHASLFVAFTARDSVRMVDGLLDTFHSLDAQDSMNTYSYVQVLTFETSAFLMEYV
jgi:hypothetical protein